MRAMTAEAPHDGAGPAPSPLPARVVLFDGVCVMCNGFVRWLVRRDPTARLHFASLQGEVAAGVRARHPDVPALDTVVYVDASDGRERVFLNSEALFRVFGELDGGWRRLAWFGVLPRWITDPLYRVVVALRYRLFGRLDACPVPTPAERDRFLDGPA